jgi:hypothetical protein
VDAMSIKSRESGVLVSTPAWLLNPQDELSRAKRTLDLHGYYAVKKDRVKKLSIGSSTAMYALQMRNASGYEDCIKRTMFQRLAHELSEVIPVTVSYEAEEDRRYYLASVGIILPRKD